MSGTAEEAEPEECRFCGDPVDPLEPGHFKSPGDKFAHPQCVADHCYGDREKVATDEGTFRIKSVLIEKRVGNKEEILDSYWQADCPVCYRTHETEKSGEDVRSELIDEVLDCCGAEWMPPSDWVEGCDICGTGHREEHGCSAPYYREPFPGFDEPARCADCGFETEVASESLATPNGTCPECGSAAVEMEVNL